MQHSDRPVRRGRTAWLVALVALVIPAWSAPAAHADTSSQTWTLRTAAETRGWDGIAYGNGLFVAVSVHDTRGSGIMTSPDGVTWTSRTPPAGSYAYRDVVWSGTQFVAVGNSGRAMTSPDGITWTGRAMANLTKNYYGVAYGAGLFVAVGGTNGAIETSPDGITWTSQGSGTTSNLRDVTYGNGLFVAVGSTAVGQPQVTTSPDGTTWTTRSAAEANGWYGVEYGNGLFVAVSTDGTNRVMTSPDGITWTSRSAASSAMWRSVAYGAGTWTAIAGNGTDGSDADLGGGAVMNSPDGITWYSATPASTTSWRNVTYGNGLFVVVSDAGAVMTAPPATYSGAPGLVVRQSVPLAANGTCAGIDDSAFGYGTGLQGGWSRSWQPWPNQGAGGYACIRALVHVGGGWRVDNSVA